MLEKNKRERIIALVNKEVVPAIGCTEPMAVALCTAKAATTLGKRPDRIEVLLSPNMLKNAMGVGIPGTGIVYVLERLDDTWCSDWWCCRSGNSSNLDCAV